MKKSILNILLSSALIISTGTVTFATENTTSSIYKTRVPYTQENVEKYENVKTSLVDKLIATAYVNELVKETIAVKSYDTFGISENEPLSIDRNDQDKKGFSIARGTWLYKNTNISKLVDDLKLGIDVEVIWNNGSEYVHIDDVDVEVKQ